MSAEQYAKPRQPSEDHQEDILEAEAHGQEPPESDEGILSSRSSEYSHAERGPVSSDSAEAQRELDRQVETGEENPVPSEERIVVAFNDQSGGRKLLSGGLAGIASTAVMSVPIVLADRLGVIHRMPPNEVHDRVIEGVTGDAEVSPPAAAVVWSVSHLAYGAVCGVLYAAIPGTLRPDRTTTGILYGLGVWAVGYLGYLPALHLYPSVKRDSSTRTAVMIGAHMLFGATLAGLTSCSSAPRRRRN